MDIDRDSGIGTPTLNGDSDNPHVQNDSVEKELSKYVIFRIGKEKEKMFGLKSKLISKSQAFYEVVYSQKEIDLPQYAPAVFEIFLKFINTEELCFAQSHVCDLLRLAFLYEIPQITKKCMEFAINTLTLDNCVRYHKAGTLYQLEDLQIQSFKFMLRQGQAFLKHPNFFELDPFTLPMLISRDEFHIVETDLFLSLMGWVEAECKRHRYPSDRKEFHQRVRGNIFQYVRYAHMTPKEFNTIVIPTGMLNQQDMEAIMMRQTTHPTLWHTLPSYRYVDRARLIRQQVRVPLYNNIQMGFRRLSSPVMQESVRFLASHDIFLMGIEFFGPMNNGIITPYKIKYQIENEFMSYYWRTPIESTSIITANDFEVELSHPYKIDAQQPYKLTIWLEGPINQYGTFPYPQAVVIINNNMISILFADNKSTDVSGRYFNCRTQQAESPGVIKSLMFQAAP